MSITRLDIQTTQRTLPKGKPFDADLYNDFSFECSTDLASLATQWNGSLVPLLELCPDGTQDSLVNAYANGLDGRTMYVDASADTSAPKIAYYNVNRQRPKTVKEMIDGIVAGVAQGPAGPAGPPGATGEQGPAGEGGGGGGLGSITITTNAPYSSPFALDIADASGPAIILAQWWVDFSRISGTNLNMYMGIEQRYVSGSITVYPTWGIFFLPDGDVMSSTLFDTHLPVLQLSPGAASDAVYHAKNVSFTVANPGVKKQVLFAAGVDSHGSDVGAVNFEWRSMVLDIIGA